MGNDENDDEENITPCYGAYGISNMSKPSYRLEAFASNRASREKQTPEILHVKIKFQEESATDTNYNVQ